MVTQSENADNIELLCSGRYSACDISDVLMDLGVRHAGFLPDIVPIPQVRQSSSRPLVAPVTTVLFVHNSGTHISEPKRSNIPVHQHWTDMPVAGSVALLQQPPELVCAVLGDIMATHLYLRGIREVIVDGRVRDIGPIGNLCAEKTTTLPDGAEAPFQVWSKQTSTISSALECKAWCVDVPITIGKLTVQSGDLLFADESERGAVVIPQCRIKEVVAMLPGYKDKDDLRVADVEAGYSILEAIKQHP